MQPSSKTRERTAMTFWMAFILMFFVIQGAVWAVAISFTSNDLSHAVVEGYDEQALSWDEVKQARIESEKLGWKSKINIHDAVANQSFRVLELTLLNRDEQPVESAVIKLHAFHRGAAAAKQSLDFKNLGDGRYQSKLDAKRFGTWCFSGTATIAQQRFIIGQKLQIEPSSGNGEVR